MIQFEKHEDKQTASSYYYSLLIVSLHFSFLLLMLYFHPNMSQVVSYAAWNIKFCI